MKYQLPENWEEHYEGKGCRCCAHGSNECGCDADWTPFEVYALKDEINHLRGVIKDAREMVADWALYVSDYFTDKHDLEGDLKKLDDKIANNERKPDLTNFDTSNIPAGNIFEEIMSEEIKKTWT